MRAWRRTVAVVAAVGATAAAVLAPGGVASAETVRQAQWQLRALQIDQVHRITTGTGVLVGLVDSGVEVSNPDLAGLVAGGTGIGTAAGPQGGSADTDGHGTAMAGLIGARGGDENHALGIAPGAKVLSVRIQFNEHAGNEQGVYEGIRWAVDHGARVVNVSLAGSGEPLDFERQAIAYALDHDVVVVAGAGNTALGQSAVGTPANIPGVIAVGGTTMDGSYWSGAVTGPQMVLAAPSDRVVSTASRAAGSKTGYSSCIGTSCGTAIVTGAVALVRSKYPDLKAPDVINRLIRTADDAGPPARDAQYGFGRLNILRALTAQVPHVDANPLGNPLGAPAGTATRTDTGSAGGTTGSLSKALTGFGLTGLVCLVVVLVPVGLLVMRSRRRRRAAVPVGYGPVGYGPPPGAYPPRQWSPQSGPPPGAQPGPPPRWGPAPPGGPPPGG